VNVLNAETLTAYEIGSKNRFIEDRLQLNFAGYFYRYGGFQTAALSVSGNPNVPLFEDLSVPVRVAGAEIEMLYQLTRDDRFGLNLAYTHSYYVDKSALFASLVAEGDLAPLAPGQENALIPLVTANLNYDHYFHLPRGSTLIFHGDGRYLGSSEGHEDATQAASGATSYVRIAAQGIGDLSLTWIAPNERYSASGYVRNVSDNRYITSRPLGTETAPFTYSPTQYEPRTYGVIVNAHF
jgi:iron complex outermembrane receptor protein